MPENLLQQSRSGATTLHVAARLGAADAVRVLLSQGADADAKDKYGWTARQWATLYSRDHVADELAGAELNQIDNSPQAVLKHRGMLLEWWLRALCTVPGRLWVLCSLLAVVAIFVDIVYFADLNCHRPT